MPSPSGLVLKRLEDALADRYGYASVVIARTDFDVVAEISHRQVQRGCEICTFTCGMLTRGAKAVADQAAE